MLIPGSALLSYIDKRRYMNKRQICVSLSFSSISLVCLRLPLSSLTPVTSCLFLSFCISLFFFIALSLHLSLSLAVGMFSLSVVRAVSEVHSSSALLMFLFAYLLRSVFWNSPSLCTPAESLHDTGKHPTIGSKHFYLSFSYRFRKPLRNKRTMCSWPALRSWTVALLCCIWDFLYSQ